MSFRQVIVNSAEYLSLDHNSLVAVYNDDKTKIPIEDIAIILIENNRTSITVDLINKCTENNIVIITCNKRKFPQSIIMPMINHYRYLENTYMQLEMNTVKKQNLWREITKMKIGSQSKILQLCDCHIDDIEELEVLKKEVQRNDSTNREAVAAKVFFSSIHGDEFKRFTDTNINAALNYGYTVLVSSIVRQLVSFGLDPKLGFWHSSKSNNLNLAYDLVEPFRPVVDYYIFKHYEEVIDGLSPFVRRGLVSLLNANVEVEGDLYKLQNAIELFVKRIMQIIRKEKENLLAIDFIKIKFYELQ
ncbi:MAG: type II CRISPR-associated endonuclease Cas1 [Lachnospirales bacterium]